VLAERVGPDGRVIGVDLEPTDAVAPNVTVLALDMTEPATHDAIAAALGRPADAVLCDAAPKLTGIRDVDLAAIEELRRRARDRGARDVTRRVPRRQGLSGTGERRVPQGAAPRLRQGRRGPARG
jgi:23S rRNA U2552 (ribose-2'-O)-methylase RlmE/FtsJ